MMRKLLLALLLAFIVEHAPWRLLALMSEALVLRPGLTQVVQTNDRYWDAQALQIRLYALGWTVTYQHPVVMGEQEVYGQTILQLHLIQVDSALSWDARFAVLAHEGAHALQDIPEWSDSGEGEGFAEAVAAVMAQDGFREHARYLSSHKLALLNTIVFKHARVYRVAALLQE